MPLEFCAECKAMHYRTDPCRPLKHESVKLERVIPKQVEPDDISKPVARSDAPKRGRPRTILDMRAYKRDKERLRRAKLKAANLVAP